MPAPGESSPTGVPDNGTGGARWSRPLSGGGMLRRLRAAARRVDRATPDSRERAIDGLRALAICAVFTGHWLVSALVVWEGGELGINSPLRYMPELSPISWLFSLLALFFLVGGYVGARGLDRSRRRGHGDRSWLRGRVHRLARPVLLVSAVWGLVMVTLVPLGVPWQTVRSGAMLTVQPMWFVLVFLAVTLLTPCLVAADRRWGLRAALPAPLLVAVVDLLRYGPWEQSVPSWIGLLNVIPAWMFCYQLGIAWERGRLGRAAVAVLVIGGAAGLALLVTSLGYPASTVGIPGTERTNSHPPSLFVPVLAMVQIGIAVLLRDRVERLLRRPLLWAGVASLNAVALTVFCWHQSALTLVSAVGAVWGVLPGLTAVPADPWWILARVAWLAVFAAVLVPLVLLFRRFEGQWRTTVLASWPARTGVGAFAAAYAGVMLAEL